MAALRARSTSLPVALPPAASPSSRSRIAALSFRRDHNAARASSSTSTLRHGARLTSQFRGTVLTVIPASCSKTRRRSPALSPRSEVLVQKVTAKELDEILTNERTSPMIIDFYATWCGPCVLLAQDLELLAVEYGEDVRFLKVDTDEEHELASQMQIRGLPTMVFVSKDVDKLAIRTEGLLPLDAIRDIIEKEILDDVVREEEEEEEDYLTNVYDESRQ